MMRRMIVTGWAALVVAGCSHNDMMSDYIGSFDDHVAAVKAEVTTHGAAIATAQWGSVGSLEDSHYAFMLNHMTGMNYDVSEMSSCAGGNMQNMSMDMDDMARECSNHSVAMATAADLTAARAEETRYQNAMANLLTRMRMHTGSMMSGNGTADCMH